MEEQNSKIFASWKRTCEANAADENNSFIFTVCVTSVPRHYFKLAYVVLSKNLSKPTSKNGEMGRFNPSLLAESFYLTLRCH